MLIPIRLTDQKIVLSQRHWHPSHSQSQAYPLAYVTSRFCVHLSLTIRSEWKRGSVCADTHTSPLVKKSTYHPIHWVHQNCLILSEKYLLNEKKRMLITAVVACSDVEFQCFRRFLQLPHLARWEGAIVKKKKQLFWHFHSDKHITSPWVVQQLFSGAIISIKLLFYTLYWFLILEHRVYLLLSPVKSAKRNAHAHYGIEMDCHRTITVVIIKCINYTPLQTSTEIINIFGRIRSPNANKWTTITTVSSDQAIWSDKSHSMSDETHYNWTGLLPLKTVTLCLTDALNS